MITAKVRCDRKAMQGDELHPSTLSAQVHFGPDYLDGRNKAWSLATPHLDLNMTLNGEAAGLFEQGKAYTLQFVETD